MNNTASAHIEARSPSLRADDHKILFMLMEQGCGVMVLIRKAPPELSLLILLSFYCLLSPTKARQLPWCDMRFTSAGGGTRARNVRFSQG